MLFENVTNEEYENRVCWFIYTRVPIASCGLRLDDEVVRVAIGLRLDTPICAEHFCNCGAWVDNMGTHVDFTSLEQFVRLVAYFLHINFRTICGCFGDFS